MSSRRSARRVCSSMKSSAAFSSVVCGVSRFTAPALIWFRM
jgi:hypothetical protein